MAVISPIQCPEASQRAFKFAAVGIRSSGHAGGRGGAALRRSGLECQWADATLGWHLGPEPPGRVTDSRKGSIGPGVRAGLEGKRNVTMENMLRDETASSSESSAGLHDSHDGSVAKASHGASGPAKVGPFRDFRRGRYGHGRF